MIINIYLFLDKKKQKPKTISKLEKKKKNKNDEKSTINIFQKMIKLKEEVMLKIALKQ